MPFVKRGINRSPQTWVFDTLNMKGFPSATLGAGVLTSAVQSTLAIPFAIKIPMVVVACSAIDSLAGTDGFNIVVGYGAYTSGSAGLAAANDNSDVNVAAPGAAVSGGLGYPTVYAAAGNAVFGTDQAFTATAGVGVAATTGEPALAVPTTAAGGSWRFVPTNYDAVYPAGSILTLRVFTTAATGAITNMDVCIAYTPIFCRGELPYYTDIVMAPGVDW